MYNNWKIDFRVLKSTLRVLSVLSPLPILTLEHLEEPSSSSHGQVYFSDERAGNKHTFTGVMH